VRVVRAEQVGGAERSPYVVYVLQVVSLGGGPEMRRRFSEFTELLSTLGREAGVAAARGSAGHAVVESWKRQLSREKRHTGKASRSAPVVQARYHLLQRMLDELLAVPEIATSVGLALFLAGEAANPNA
jgi:hypothetical protein